MTKKDELSKGFDIPKKLPTPKKRTQVPDKSARQFVAGDQKTKGESKMKRQTRGERLTVYIPPELASELRVLCVSKRRSVSDAVTEAISNWLNNNRN